MKNRSVINLFTTVAVSAVLIFAAALTAPLLAEEPRVQSETKSLVEDPIQILISLEERRLFLLSSGDTLFHAPVGIGKGTQLSFEGRTYVFDTPKGTRKVIKKEEHPLWTPPDWHYHEKAQARGYKVVRLQEGETYRLSDGTSLEIRDGEVGRRNLFGNWWPITPGSEIIFDNKIFVPPLTAPQRKITKILGTRKLDLGNGYYIHGTNDPSSVGDASSHGCIRMTNEDVEYLYEIVPLGTRVVIR